MKQIISMLIALAALLCLGGCKRTESANFEIVGTVVGTGDAASSPAESEEDEAATERDLLGKPKPALLNGMKEIDEKTISFDLEALSSLSTRVSDEGMYLTTERENTFTELMEFMGEEGVIVAGYATGQRESHILQGTSPNFTLTRFVVTDLYYGEAPSEIKIRESYYLSMDKNNEWCFERSRFSTGARLANDVQLLLCLKKNEEADCYYIKYEMIRLPEDYRAYSEEFKGHFLDFFRGVKSEYRKQGGDTKPQALGVHIDENGKEVYTVDPSADSVMPTFFWPKRDISDEELLAELQENVVVRLVTDFKIKIWPYGHKNYTFGGFGTGLFAKSCMPD